VYFSGTAVHELELATGRDRIVARAPAGATMIDAQIEKSLVAYAYRSAAEPSGRVVVLQR
jgi:hypothetical protein